MPANPLKRLKIAAISDIHGNLHALQAVLADIGLEGVDHIINWGDTSRGPLNRPKRRTYPWQAVFPKSRATTSVNCSRWRMARADRMHGTH
jgi:Icc-related predicted phosphoesterase